MYIILFLAWIIFNGALTAEIVVFGLIVSAVVMAFTIKFLGYSIEKEMMLYRLTPYILSYMLVLIAEVCKANAAIVKLILNPRVTCEPKVFMFKAPLKTRLCQVMLANSITLTPGTITVECDKNGDFVVHCLDMELAEGIEESVFVERLRKIEAVMEVVNK